MARRGTEPCTIAGCPTKIAARGWCAKHYNHWQRFGDPLAGRFYGDDARLRYEGAHARVKVNRGSASQYECSCGAPAVDWAYDNNDPEERVSEKGYAYSIKPEHYVPMCRRCHKQHDINHRLAAAAAYRQIRFGGASCA